jgi:hypothetical protein
VIYIDRRPPVSEIEKIDDGGVWIRSSDQTATSVHVFANLPGDRTEAQILADVDRGEGRLDRIDRALFRGEVAGLRAGQNELTVVTFELSGNHSIQRLTAAAP